MRQTDYMVGVPVREKQVDGGICLGRALQMLAEATEARACIEYERRPTGATHFDAGGVAPVAYGARPR
jgi:hypothetical protein